MNDISSRAKGPAVACGANNEGFLAFDSRRTHATKNGLCLRATIMTDEKKKKYVNESPMYKCFMSASERIHFLEMSNCKRQSRAESFLQIENRRKEQHSKLAVNNLNRASFLIS